MTKISCKFLSKKKMLELLWTMKKSWLFIIKTNLECWERKKKKKLHHSGQSTYIFNILAESRDAGGAHNYKFSFRIQNHMVGARRRRSTGCYLGPLNTSLCGPERLSLRKSTIDSKRQYLPLVSDQSYFFCFLLILIWRVRSSFKK